MRSLFKWRTALVGEIHGSVGEYGTEVAKGIGSFRRRAAADTRFEHRGILVSFPRCSTRWPNIQARRRTHSPVGPHGQPRIRRTPAVAARSSRGSLPVVSKLTSKGDGPRSSI